MTHAYMSTSTLNGGFRPLGEPRIKFGDMKVQTKKYITLLEKSLIVSGEGSTRYQSTFGQKIY